MSIGSLGPDPGATVDPFEPPKSDELDDVVRDQAASNLYRGAGAAIGLGLLQYCCNPFFIVTIMASGAALNALRQPRWLKISLDEDYPESAGTVSTVAGVVGLLLVALRVLLAILSIGLATADIATR